MCASAWSGAVCEQPVCNNGAGCGTQGICLAGALSSSHTCYCSVGWTGPTCATAVCVHNAAGVECGAHGMCQASSSRSHNHYPCNPQQQRQMELLQQRRVLHPLHWYCDLSLLITFLLILFFHFIDMLNFTLFGWHCHCCCFGDFGISCCLGSDFP